MKIGVLSYNYPHRKTQDILCRLKLEGIDDVTLFLFPWIERTLYKPLYIHRPTDVIYRSQPSTMVKNLGYGVKHLVDYSANLDCNILLIGGAGILPQDFVQMQTVVNSHPGYLPNVRGLDAVKWAIYENQPIGASCYICGPEPDTGLLIERQNIELISTDTLHSVFQKVYELEIKLLIRVARGFSGPNKYTEKLGTTYNDGCEIPCPSPVHQRMPHACEILLSERLKNRIILG